MIGIHTSFKIYKEICKVKKEGHQKVWSNEWRAHQFENVEKREKSIRDGQIRN